MISAQPSLRRDVEHIGILFAEDFDVPEGYAHALVPEDPEPEIIVPSFSPEELAAARAEAFEDGERAGRSAARLEDDARGAAALVEIGRALADAEASAAAVSGEAADALARLLLAGFAVIAPSVCARHGEDEALAIMRIVLPALRTEPRIAVRVASELVDGMQARLGDLDPDLLARIELIPAAMAPGDVRVSWRDGEAVRDTDAIWRAIAEALAPLDLGSLLPGTQKATTELSDGH